VSNTRTRIAASDRARVRRAASPQVRIVSGPAFELIAELAAFESGPARAALESGKTWIRDVRRLAAPELIRRVDGWALPLYTELAPIALEAGEPFAIEGLVERIRSLPADRLRRRLLGVESAPNQAMLSDGAFDRALAGNVRARAEVRRTLGLNPPARRSIERLFATPAETLQTEVARIVEAWATTVFPAFADEALELIRRDVLDKERLLRSLPAIEAVRASTNGVEFDLTGWATEIVLAPTVALRPFIAPAESGPIQIVLCSVADEAFDEDPGAPPRRLVKVASALGDELRLRILRELVGGEYTASELSARLGVERTSLHHHLGILRSAGLISARAEGLRSWRYASHPDGIRAASSGLQRYLDVEPVSRR
jgi:DNA-binding transcriptional ArsR family regulator